MWYKYILWSILIILAAWLQIFISSQTNLVLANFNFILVVLVILINLAPFNRALWFLILGVSILDIYSSLPFGIFLASYFFTALILEALFLNFFTNRSIYSLIILGVISIAAYNAFFLSISGILYYFGASDYFTDWSYIQSLGWQFVDTLCLLLAAFFAINYLSKRFKPVFLRS